VKVGETARITATPGTAKLGDTGAVKVRRLNFR
jgi:hypothetical protein